MHDTEWRWADPSGQQRRIRLDELRAALASGLVAPNAPVWCAGWVAWREAREVPELSSSALSAEHGLLPNIPPPPLAVVAAQSQYEAQASGGLATATHAEPPPPPPYVPLAAPQAAPPGHSRPSAPVPAPPASAPKAAPSGPKLPEPPASGPKPEPPSAPSASAKPPEVAPVPKALPSKLATQLGMPAVQRPVTTPLASPAPPPAPALSPAPPPAMTDELSWSAAPVGPLLRPTAPAVPAAMHTPKPAPAAPSKDLLPAPNVPAAPASAEELSSSSLLDESSSSYSYVEPRSSKPKSGPRGPSMPPPAPKAPSMPPPAPKGPSMPPPATKPLASRPPPPVVPSVPLAAEELSSSLLESAESGAFELARPVRSQPPPAPKPLASRPPPPVAPVAPSVPLAAEELSSSLLLSADSTGAIPAALPFAATVAAAREPAKVAADPAPAAGSSVSVPTSLFGTPSPIAPEGPPKADQADAQKPVPTSLFGTPVQDAPKAAPVPTSLFGTPSPVGPDGTPVAPVVAPAAAPVTPFAPVESGSGSVDAPPRSGISVPTAIGIGLPVGEISPHPVVVPPPASQPTSDAAAYFQRADRDEPPKEPSPSRPEGSRDAAGSEVDLSGVVAPSPIDQLRKTLGPVVAKARAFAEAKSKENRFFLPVVGVSAAAFGVLVLAGLVKACSGGDDPSATKAKPSPSASSSVASGGSASAVALASASAPPPASASVPPPPPAAPSVTCKLTGDAVTLAEKTSLGAGVEVLAEGGVLAVGYASSPKEGHLVKVGEGLAPTAAGKLTMGEPVRRVLPFLRKGKLELSVEIDKKILGLSSRRVAPLDPPIDVGVGGSSIAYAPHLRTGAKDLFAVGEGPVEGLRVVTTSDKGVGVAFRHSGSVHVGFTSADLAPLGEVQKAKGVGDKIGAPALAVSEGTWLSAFAERSGDGPWTLRLFGGKVGGAAFEPKPFVLPKGGPGGSVISPSLLGLAGGAYLLTWTEGPENGRVVRAHVVDASGDSSGAPIEVSPSGVNAGQARGAVDASGKGILAYFSSKEEGYRLVAVPITCGN
ncbi:MAG: DUF4339 domain-containing protein [Myxococcales bacterium]|nr:DUF4339 domain-containing protein [Myxococcales bacterium]